jgi:hypothetical protein
MKDPEANQASASNNEKSRSGHFQVSSALVERFGANPAFGGRGAVGLDAAVMQGPVENGEVK